MARSHLLRCLLVLLAFLYSCGRSAEQYLADGNELYKAGKFADAAIIYKKALQVDPNLIEARYRLGLTDLAQNNYTEAFLALRDSYQGAISDPTDARIKLADLSLMLCLSLPEPPEFARNLLGRLAADMLNSDPSSFDGNRLQGQIAILDGNTNLALEHLQFAAEKRPLDRDVTIALVQLLFQQKRYEEAESLAKQLIAKYPDWGPIYDVLSRQYTVRGRRTDAERLLKERVAANPTEADFALILAGFYGEQGNNAAMESALQTIVDNSGYKQRWLRVGDFRTFRKEYDAAYQVYSTGLSSSPNEVALYKTRMATVQLLRKNVAEARRLAEEALQQDPQNKEARLMRANLLLTSSEGDAAATSAQDYEKLLEFDPGNAIVLVNLARAQFAKGDANSARRNLVKAIGLKPSLLEARYFLAQIGLNTGKPQIALEQADQMLATTPQDPQAQLLRATALIRLQKSDEAKAILDKLAKTYPAAQEIQIQLAAVAIQQGRHPEAAAIYSRLRAQGGGSSQASAAFALLKSNQQQYSDAIQSLQAELAKKPDSISLRELLASTYATAGKHAEAIAEYQTLVSKHPNSADLYLGLGSIYQGAEDHAAATRAFAKAVELAPDQPLPLLLWAGSSEQLGKVDDAILCYRRVLQLQPDNAVACNNLALALAMQGKDLKEALELSLRANKSAPGQPALQDTLGVVYLKSGNLPDALSVFKILSTNYPADAGYRVNLGQVLLAMNKPAEAKAELSTALANQPTKEQTQTINRLLANLP